MFIQPILKEVTIIIFIDGKKATRMLFDLQNQLIEDLGQSLKVEALRMLSLSWWKAEIKFQFDLFLISSLRATRSN